MNKMFTKFIVSSFIFVLAFSFCVIPAMAQPELGLNYATNLGLASQEGDVRDTAVDIVKYLMTFLGIIAVVVILLGGFKWMTAGGNEDKVAEAKKLLVAGMVGLVIILAAFAIVTFVIQITDNAISGEF